jgi:BASS family bile acid:Na+ symporter
MKKESEKRNLLSRLLSVIGALFIFIGPGALYAGEDIYRELMMITQGKGDTKLFSRLNETAAKIDWKKTAAVEFKGNIRLLKTGSATGQADQLFMVRNINGDLYFLAPDEHSGLNEMLGDKFIFKLQFVSGEVDGKKFNFAKLSDKPARTTLDRVFKISIVLMLFFVMVGMGLTLTLDDFKRVFQKPKGIISGAFLQWVVMPLVAVGVGRLMGFYETFPFIFVGIVLIAVSPGGVTSNLMTYYAKGDLALSISLTSLSTVLSLFFTPLLLALYCANVPEVTIPVALIIQTITVLVIIPLTVGMTIQARAPRLAVRATPFFSALGLAALLFLIIAGVLSNIEVFTDTERYGVRFYTMIFMLTFLGMFAGIIVPKLIKLSNYQTRAISLETGLRNASLAMAIALLIQDYMGDFFSSMFVTSAIFGLMMYIAGFISLWIFKKFLPVKGEPEYEMKFNTEDEA